MHVVVPFDATAPKSRLSPVLDQEERLSFANAMCRDVLAALRATGREPTVLATAPTDLDAPTVVDDRPLTEAVNAVLTDHEGPVAVVMADLALATPEALARLFAPAAEVVLAPGLGGGTNAVLARHPDFRVDYHGPSIRDHREAARGMDTAEVDSRRLATDIDEPRDLAELLLHGEGAAADWLHDAGFELAVDGGRVGVTRR